MITFYAEWDAAFNAVTAFLLTLFGAWLWTIRPRTRLSLSLGLFAVAHGVMYVEINVVASGGPPGSLANDVWELSHVPFQLVAAAGLVLAAREVLREMGQARFFAKAAIAGAVFVAVVTLAELSAFPLRTDPRGRATDVLTTVGTSVFIVVFAVLPLVFAWVYRLVPDAARPRALVLSAALVLWPAVYAVDLTLDGEDVFLEQPLGMGVFVAVAATGLVWIANTTTSARHARRARDLAFLVFGMMLVGTLDTIYLTDVLGYGATGGPLFGLARLIAVLVLSYAVLRHQVLGMDVKFRWGISRSTVAAAFIAVFFLASEGAQLFFGQENEVVGLMAAGALVFALAPLQRAADRLAERAVPMAQLPHAPPRIPHSDRAEHTFREAIRYTLRDGKMTPKEELHLARLATHLGIAPDRAVEIRHEIESVEASS